MMLRSKILLAVLIITSFTSSLLSQDILMTIGDKDITLDEFERIYKKNNSSLALNQQTPEEYLDLFINFKLKVLEAESLGMDTTKKFLDEFNGYKDQLAKPYLTDEETRDQLIREAYERMKYDIHVSHILLRLNPQASPEDTLARYNAAMEIRQRILNGEDFETVARATSEDQSVQSNGGDLGFFTVFMMIYPFETAAYKLKDGEVSMPVRTNYGYHIIYKHETRPAFGQVQVAHIFIRVPEGSSREDAEAAKNKIYSIADSIKNGADFAEMAKKYSDDRNSAPKGGELPWFGTGRMIKEFETAAFALKDEGDISEPFKSFYGWHLVKLLDKKPIGSFEAMQPELQTQALKGDRDRVKRQRYLEKLKGNYDYKLNKEVYNKIYGIVDESVFEGKWAPVISPEEAALPLFTISTGTVTLGEFVDYILKHQKKRTPMPVVNYVDMTFSEYLEPFMLNVEKESLPERFPEYKYILQEYHDGILLFDLMDQKVWTYAVEDTLGLEKFFADHRDEYMWDKRSEAIIVSLDSTADVNAVYKKASKIASGKWDEGKLNSKYCSNDTIPCISLENLLVEKGKNSHVDDLNGNTGTGKIYTENGNARFVIVSKIVPPSKKELNETRGQVTSDYQDYLEKKWVEELRNKYKVSVNKAMLSKIE